MISFKSSGNLLSEDVDALVNAVNCVGVMGKGIALAFKQIFPDNFHQYKQACKDGKVRLGQMFIVPTISGSNPKYIINFPTKKHWKDKSRIEDVQIGLAALVDDIKRLNITSIGLPALGCGLGGLDWKDVKPLIESAFAKLSDVQVVVFEPQ